VTITGKNGNLAEKNLDTTTLNIKKTDEIIQVDR